MIVYAMFDCEEIRFFSFDLDVLRANGSVVLDGSNYTPIEIGENWHVTEVKGKKVQVFIIKRKNT